MKNFFSIALCTIFVLSLNCANATIRRVGYFGTPIIGTDYANLQSAHDSARAGDTLLIFPGAYSTAYFSKKLVVIGYGYFVNGQGADSGVQVITGTLNLDIRLGSGSDSTILQGLDGLEVIPGPSINIKGISIKRCNLSFGYSDEGTLINWKITQSVVYFFGIINNAVLETFQNLLLESNIITSMSLNQTTSSGCTGVFNNNIFTSDPNFNNGGYSLYNNIFLGTTAISNTANCTFDYNIATNNVIPTGTGTHNKSNIDLSTLFAGYPNQGDYSNDGRYALASGSPAKRAGEGGIDCGIFGGTNPYRLGGIPAIPSFYKLTAPSNIASSNPYTITFSVRSNN